MHFGSCLNGSFCECFILRINLLKAENLWKVFLDKPIDKNAYGQEYYEFANVYFGEQAEDDS
jgi:hypothetical protein